MYKKSFFFAIMIMGFTCIQCTEDETVENAVFDTETYSMESGEEGDQELDNERD